MHLIALSKQQLMIWLPCYDFWPATGGSLSLVYIAYVYIYTHIVFPDMTG